MRRAGLEVGCPLMSMIGVYGRRSGGGIDMFGDGAVN